MNLGRITNFISGITGVTAGGTATVNLPVNLRVHKLVLNCQAQTAYTAPYIVPGPNWAGGLWNAAVEGTVTAGNISAWVIKYAGVGLTNGTYTTAAGQIMIVDSTGAAVAPAVTLTVAGNLVSACTGTVTAAVGPVNPAALITALRVKVNGTVVRDITPANVLAVCIGNGYIPQYGSLPVFFTEPWRNLLRENTLTSWDLAGQSSFSVEMQIGSGFTSPSVTGIIQYDYNRNMRKVKSAAQAAATGVAIGGMAPFCLATAQHQFSIPIPAGRYDVTVLPWQKPTLRMWLQGSVPGNIYQGEVYYDNGNLAYQATAQQNYEDLSEMGYQVGNINSAPVNQGGGVGPASSTGQSLLSGLFPSTVPQGPIFLPDFGGVVIGAPNSLIPGNYSNGFPFDFAAVFDADQRPWEGLRCTKGMFVRVYSNVAQTLTIVQETSPGAFSG